MNTLKIALSALALAALAAAPAVAKSRTQSQTQVPAYSNSGNTVYGEGHVLGTDPDPRIRSEILRDGNPAYNGS
jgi:hypothetical protein